MHLYLDTHVVAWLFYGQHQKLSDSGRSLIESSETLISPMVRLELSLLHEIGRISDSAETVVEYLEKRIGLSVCTAPFDEVLLLATSFRWTRDPFDRVISAHAQSQAAKLLTKDRTIRRNCSHAYW